MPIINQVVKGSGGSAPAHYVEYDIDANGSLVVKPQNVNLDGVKQITKNSVFYQLYDDMTSITGDIVIKDLEQVGQSNCINQMYARTGITSATFNKLSYVAGQNSSTAGMWGCFRYCQSMTSLSCPELQTIASYACNDLCHGADALASVYMPKLILVDSNGLGNAFNGTAITSFDVSKVAYIGAGAFSGAFGSTGIQTLSFNGLAFSASGNRCTNGSFSAMLSGCSNVTVHFPSDWETTMASWSNITNGMGGTNTTVLFDLPAVTSVDLSSYSALWRIQNAYRDCASITSVNVSNVEKIVYLWCTFLGTSITTMEWKSLKDLSNSNALYYTYSNCLSLSSLWFYAVENYADNDFSKMISGCTNVTVHFPIREQSKITTLNSYRDNFGGTTPTILFDLVTSLTGADTNTYTRSEKDSTATATAWKYNDVLYYTSGVSNHTAGVHEPSVSDAIYSDAACTQSVTTITAIA